MKRKLGKYLAAFVLVGVMLVSQGCSKQDADSVLTDDNAEKKNYLLDDRFDTDEFLEGYDCNNILDAHSLNSVMFPGGIMGTRPGLGRVLKYYDYNADIEGVVCHKPECMHNDDTCDGYLSSLVPNSLSYYNGKLYWIGGTKELYGIWESELSGLNRKLVKELDRQSCIIKYSPQHSKVHRGYYYMSGINNTVKDGNICDTASLIYTSLSSKDDCQVAFEKTYDGSISIDTRYYGNYVYLAIRCSNNSKDVIQHLDIIRFDSKTRVCEEILSEDIDDETDGWFGGFSIGGDGKLYFVLSGDCSRLMKLDEGQIEEIYRFEDELIKFERAFIKEGIAIACGSDEQKNMKLWIIDFEGNTLYKGEMPTDCAGAGRCIFGGDKDYLYIGYDLKEGPGWKIYRYNIIEEMKETLLLQYD